MYKHNVTDSDREKYSRCRDTCIHRSLYMPADCILCMRWQFSSLSHSSIAIRLAWYWQKRVLHSGWLCITIRSAFFIERDVVHWWFIQCHVVPTKQYMLRYRSSRCITNRAASVIAGCCLATKSLNLISTKWKWVEVIMGVAAGC